MKSKAKVIITLLAVVVTVGLAAPATADPNFTPRPDVGEHSYCYRSPDFTPNLEITTRVPLAMATVEYQTIVNTTFKTSCGPHTDVQVQQYFIDDHTYGQAVCFKVTADGRCDRHAVIMGWGEINQDAGDRLAQIRKTLCHEIGHTLGLSHYADYQFASPDGFFQSCMRSGIHDDSLWWQWSYGSHHIDNHINPWWS